MDIFINELRYKKNGHFNIDFESSALMKYIFTGDDSEIFLEIEDEMQPYRQIQLVVDAYLDKANSVLKCIGDLYKLSKTKECKGKVEWVIDIPPTLQVVMNIKSQIKELVAITRENDIPAAKENSTLDSYLSSQKEIDKVEEQGIKATDLKENLSAYWLAPNGDAYGLNGDIANLLHNQIADMLVEANIVVLEDDNIQTADELMMKNGWLKLHNGEVIGDHVYNEILITQEQKDSLITYCLGQPEYVLYMNHKIMQQFITKARLEMTELGALTDMLDIGMKKKGSKKKKSIRNIRKNPLFK
jgi:hypothetical protein